MRVRCKLELNYSDARFADIVYRSVKVDDERFVKSSLDGNKLIAEIESDSAGSLLHTLDDYLACISIAEKILDKD